MEHGNHPERALSNSDRDVLGHGREREMQPSADQLPAGDLGYMKFVGRLQAGHPWGRASVEEVERFFAPYEPWRGLAGLHALCGAGSAPGQRLAA